MTISTRSFRSLAVLALGACLVAAAAAPARAQAMDPDARAHFDNGIALFAAKDYDKAIDELLEGYFIDAQPDFLYAIGQVYRVRGDCTRAIGTYKAFLRKAPPVAKAQKARKNIERCEKELAANPVKPDPVKPNPVKPDPVKPARARPRPLVQGLGRRRPHLRAVVGDGRGLGL